jgi:hypothetical protein
MSRGLGKAQRAVLAVLEDSVVGGHVMPVTAQDIAQRIWDEPSRSQVGSVRRALNGLHDRGLARGRWSNRTVLWEAAGN